MPACLRKILILSIPIKHSIILMTQVLMSFYKFPTSFSIASMDPLFVSFYPEGVLQLQMINFNFEAVQVTWNASQYSGTNLTFLYK